MGGVARVRWQRLGRLRLRLPQAWAQKRVQCHATGLTSKEGGDARYPAVVPLAGALAGDGQLHTCAGEEGGGLPAEPRPTPPRPTLPHPATGMFITAMAANPLAVNLAQVGVGEWVVQ